MIEKFSLAVAFRIIFKIRPFSSPFWACDERKDLGFQLDKTGKKRILHDDMMLNYWFFPARKYVSRFLLSSKKDVEMLDCIQNRRVRGSTLSYDVICPFFFLGVAHVYRIASQSGFRCQLAFARLVKGYKLRYTPLLLNGFATREFLFLPLPKMYFWFWGQSLLGSRATTFDRFAFANDRASTCLSEGSKKKENTHGRV